MKTGRGIFGHLRCEVSVRHLICPFVRGSESFVWGDKTACLGPVEAGFLEGSYGMEGLGIVRLGAVMVRFEDLIVLLEVLFVRPGRKSWGQVAHGTQRGRAFRWSALMERLHGHGGRERLEARGRMEGHF